MNYIYASLCYDYKENILYDFDVANSSKFYQN